MTTETTPTQEYPARKEYGMWVGYCEACGWWTAGKIRGPGPTCCEACGQKPEIKQDGIQQFQVKFRDDVAPVVCALAEQVSQRLREHAEKHELQVVQISKNRWVILRYRGEVTRFGLKDGSASWAYRSLEVVQEAADWKTTTDYIRKHTPELPAYLRKN